MLSQEARSPSAERACTFIQVPSRSTALRFCCAPDAAPLARCLASSPPPLSAPRAFAPGPSAPGPAAHLAAAAAGRSAGPGTRQSALHLCLSQARAARSAEAVDAVRPRRGAGQGWPRLPHWLRVREGGDPAGIWVAWSEASRDAPGAAGGEAATTGSRGRARRGFRGSAPRAATEHAQSPSRAGAAQQKGSRCPAPESGAGGGAGGGRVKSAAPAAVVREGGGSLFAPGWTPEARRGGLKMVNLRLVNGIPEES